MKKIFMNVPKIILNIILGIIVIILSPFLVLAILFWSVGFLSLESYITLIEELKKVEK